jgi:hypothetical protein
VEGGFHFGHRKKSFRKLNKVKFQGFWRFWLLHKSGRADKGKVRGHLVPDAAVRIKLLKPGNCIGVGFEHKFENRIVGF